MNKFIGTWVQPKEVDYEGVMHINVKQVGDEIIVRAICYYPNDLPTPIIDIPISEVSYSNGKLCTYGIITTMPIKPEHRLIISIDNGRMHVIHKIKNLERDWETVEVITLFEKF